MATALTHKSMAAAGRGLLLASSTRAIAAAPLRAAAARALQQPSPSTPRRAFTSGPDGGNPSGYGAPLVHNSPGGGLPSYFQKPSLPANTIVRFVPQQTAWIVERMGKFNRILQPGLAILIPFLDRIAYVKSLKEVALEIPSQSAITADNVTLELDGVLYTRVFDAYKARCVGVGRPSPHPFARVTQADSDPSTATESRTPNTPSRSWPRRRCAPRLAS